MTITDFVMIAIGELLLAGTFALGILVGVSMSKRKDSQDDGNSYEAAQGKWHHTGPGDVARCTGWRGCGRAGTLAKADPVERFAEGRDDLRK
jgi:hypothetical protein